MVLYTEMVCIKHTVVQPFLQKLHLEVDVLSNCPPFSNLPFLSKVLKLTNTLKKPKKNLSQLTLENIPLYHEL